ncbi:MAG: Rid family hydrolase [Burkholderiaceae bacterium]
MSRQPLQTGKSWETKVPFSLGVAASGRFLHTAGITARADDGSVIGPNDMRAQVARCFENLGEVLQAAGAGWGDVVKYTIFTTDIERYDQDTRDIRLPFFVDRPAATLVEVRRLVHPEMLVEIEAVVCLR